MALSEAGDPVKSEREKEASEVSKRSEDRRKRSRSRSREDHHRSSRRSPDTPRSSKRRRESSHYSRRRRSSSRDPDEDGLCKTYPSYRGSRSRYSHRSRRSRSISRSPSTSRAASQPRPETKFDVAPMPQIQASGNTFTFTLPQLPQLPHMTKPARKIYVGGLPPLVNEAMIAEFFNNTMAEVSGSAPQPGNPVLHVYINRDKNYAFVEMRSIQDASDAMALDGILFNGVQVKIRRPADYRPEIAASFGPCQPSPGLRLDRVGLVSPNDKVFVGGLPYEWGEAEVRSLLEQYGALKSLDIIKEPETRKSKGYAFVVFQDPGSIDAACAALHEKALAGKTLRVHRANLNPNLNLNLNLNGGVELATRVVCLRNAVSEEMVRDESVFVEVVEDMNEECGKYGPLERVEIPRELPGLGKVFLEFKDLVSAQKAKYYLNGRKFDERVVVAVYYPEDKFAVRDFSG